MDRADTQSVVVDAESWQKALQAARAARGEPGPISGFSIELLDEGYRAVDPLARLRYDVKRASDKAALPPAASSASREASRASVRSFKSNIRFPKSLVLLKTLFLAQSKSAPGFTKIFGRSLEIRPSCTRSC